jgi:hypothetical protein
LVARAFRQTTVKLLVTAPEATGQKAPFAKIAG